MIDINISSFSKWKQRKTFWCCTGSNRGPSAFKADVKTITLQHLSYLIITFSRNCIQFCFKKIVWHWKSKWNNIYLISPFIFSDQLFVSSQRCDLYAQCISGPHFHILCFSITFDHFWVASAVWSWRALAKRCHKQLFSAMIDLYNRCGKEWGGNPIMMPPT